MLTLGSSVAQTGHTSTAETRADVEAMTCAEIAERLTQSWRWRQLRRAPGPVSSFGFVANLDDERLLAADADGLWIHDGRSWELACRVHGARQHQIQAVEPMPWGLVVVTDSAVAAVLPAGHAPTPGADVDELALRSLQPGTHGDGCVHLLSTDRDGAREVGLPARLDDGTLVVPLDDTLFEVRAEGLHPWVGPPLAEGERPRAIASQPGGLVTVRTTRRTWRFLDGRWLPLEPHAEVELVDPHQAVEADGSVLILDRLPCYRPGARIDPDGTTTPLPLVPGNGQLAAASRSPVGRLLIATRNGLLHAWSHDHWMRIDPPAVLDGQIVSMTWTPANRLAVVDGTGRLWSVDLGSESWTRIETREHFTGPAINAMAHARDGGLWMAGHGLARYADDAFVERVDVDDLPRGVDINTITSVVETPDGELFVGAGGAFGGVLRRTDGHWWLDQDPAGVGLFGAHAVRTAPDGSLWFALLSQDPDAFSRGGIAIHDGDGWTRLPLIERCYDIAWDASGMAYVGTSRGVKAWDGEGWRLLDDGSEASDAKAFALHVDDRGRLWSGAGTYQRGVQWWDLAEQRWTVPAEGDWRIAAAGSFAEDARGRVWMASEAGLFVAQGDDCFRVSTRGVADASVFWPLLTTDAGRRLWIGSFNSAVLSLDLHDDQPPVTTVTSVMNQDDLPEHVLVAQWHAADVWRQTEDERLRYQWRLDGGPWSRVQRERLARFSGLSSGDHRLEVRALDMAGNVEDPPASIPFRVPPPAWLGPWTLIPAGALVLALIGLGVLMARRRAERREAERRHAELTQRLSMLTRRLLAGHEAERRAISRDLHDRLGQALAATTLQLELAGRSGDPERRAAALERGAATVREVLSAVRDLACGVAPPLLNDFGLEAAVRDLANRFETRSGRGVRLRLDLERPVPERIAGQAYRVLEQALDNVLQHAEARHVSLDLHTDGGRLAACVRDDGRGFDPQGLSVEQGLGLLDMRERAESLGGHLEVDSSYHGGTSVRLKLPLETEPARSSGSIPPWHPSASSSPMTTAWSSTASPPSSKSTPTST